MATKKPSIAARPVSQTAEDFLNGAAQNLETAAEAPANKEKPKKTQVPLLIPPALLNELDELLKEDEFGISRSMWICKAIRERIDAQKSEA